jgi:hypothetical protein
MGSRELDLRREKLLARQDEPFLARPDIAPGKLATGSYASASEPGKQTATDSLPVQTRELVTRARHSSGQALPDDLQASFCAALAGVSVSQVTVHTGADSAAAAEALGARAYADGQQIHFAANEYQPGSPRGRALIAHEVAHTVQARGSAPDLLTVSKPSDRVEREADVFAQHAIAGALAPQLSTGGTSALMRKAKDEPEIATDKTGENNDKAPDKPGDKDADADMTAELDGLEPLPADPEDEPKEPTTAGSEPIADTGSQMPDEGGAGELAGGIDNQPKDSPQVAGDGSAILASITKAQEETKQAVDASKQDADQYKEETRKKRDEYDEQQQALVTDELSKMTLDQKRQTLKDMGYPAKQVKKMKAAEIDKVIAGQMEDERLRTRIHGMDPDELAALSQDDKFRYLVALGIWDEDLRRIGPGKVAKLFDDVMKVAHVEGKHNVKIKVKGGLNGRSYTIKVSCDAEGNVDAHAEKKEGFLKKLVGWLKLLLPIVLMVLGPLTGGISLIVLSIYQAAIAIQSGDWIGAIVAIAGAVTGFAVLKFTQAFVEGAYGTAVTFAKIATVATKVQKVAEAAQAAMLAMKAKKAGSLLGAIAAAAGLFAGFAATGASKFAQTMNMWSLRLKHWAAIVSGGEKVLAGIQNHDPLGALQGAFATVAAFEPVGSQAAQNLGTAGKVAGFAKVAQTALNQHPPDYAAVAEQALLIGNALNGDRRLADAARIIGSANRLKTAIESKDPAAIARAALELAESIQLARYDATHDEKKDPATGLPVPDPGRFAALAPYERAIKVVSLADAVYLAATAKPHPDYAAALDATTNLVAILTGDKKLELAGRVTAKFAAWTHAVNSKDPAAILAATQALAAEIQAARAELEADKSKAQGDAAANGAIPTAVRSHVPPPISYQDALEKQAADASLLAEVIYRGSTDPNDSAPDPRWPAAAKWVASGHVKLFAVRQTHDSATRSVALGQPSLVTTFGVDRQYNQGASSGYNETDLKDSHGIYLTTPDAGGNAINDGIYLIDASTNRRPIPAHGKSGDPIVDNIKDTITHEVGHDADEFGDDLFQHYETEFNQYYQGNGYNAYTDAAGSALATLTLVDGTTVQGFDNLRQQRVFEGLYNGKTSYSYVSDCWKKNTNNFRQRVLDLKHPAGVNLGLAPGIEDLFDTLTKGEPARALQVATKLTAAEKATIKASIDDLHTVTYWADAFARVDESTESNLYALVGVGDLGKVRIDVLYVKLFANDAAGARAAFERLRASDKAAIKAEVASASARHDWKQVLAVSYSVAPELADLLGIEPDSPGVQALDAALRAGQGGAAFSTYLSITEGECQAMVRKVSKAKAQWEGIVGGLGGHGAAYWRFLLGLESVVMDQRMVRLSEALLSNDPAAAKDFYGDCTPSERSAIRTMAGGAGSGRALWYQAVQSITVAADRAYFENELGLV